MPDVSLALTKAGKGSPAARLVLLCVAASALWASCARRHWPEPVRAASEQQFAGKTYALAHSYYVAQMYDDNEHWLLSEKASDAVSHVRSFGGRDLHPPRALAILPAGTPVVLEHIDFPTHWAVARRMLSGPRHHIWLRLAPAASALVALPTPWRPLIVVLASDIDSSDALAHAIERHLAPAEDIAQSLAKLSPSLRAAVERKECLIGMPQDALLMSLGEPDDRRSQSNLSGEPESVWRYPSLDAWIAKGMVIRVGPR